MAQPVVLSNNPIDPLLPEELDQHFMQSPAEQMAAENGTPITNLASQKAATLSQVAQSKPVVQTTTPEQSLQEAGSMVAKVEQDENTALRIQLENIAKSTLPQETRVAAANEVYTKSKNPRSLNDSFIKAISVNAMETVSTDAVAIQKYLTENNNALAETYRRISEVEAGVRLDSGADLIDLHNIEKSALIDFGVQALAPGTFGAPMISVIKEVMPDMELGPTDLVLPGEARQEFKRRLRAMKPEDQLATLTRLSEAINSFTYLGTDNDFIQQELAHNLLNFRDGSTSEKVIDNIFGVVDFAFAGMLVRDTLKGVGKGVKALAKGSRPAKARIDPVIDGSLYERVAPDSTMSAINSAAPEKASSIAESIIVNADVQLAKALDTTVESIVAETVMPKALGAVPTPSPNLGEKLIDKARLSQSTADTLRGGLRVDSAFGTTFNPVDELQAVKDKLSGVALLGKRIGAQLANSTYFEEVNDVIKGVFHIGKTNEVGFDSVQEALAVAENYKLTLESHDFVNAGYKVEIHKRDLSTNTYVPIKELDTDLGGEYRVVVELQEELLPTHALSTEVTRRDKISGFLARWWDKGAWQHGWANVGTNQAFDRHSAVIKEMRTILEPLNKLSPTNQRLIYQMLDFGDHGVGKWFTETDLKNAIGNNKDYNKLRKGYYAVRDHQERLYDYMNAATRKQLLSRGFKEMVLPQRGPSGADFELPKGQLEGKGPILARLTQPTELNDILRTIRFTESDADGKKSVLANIYDADLDQVRPITAEDIKAINDGHGIQVWEALRPIEHEGDGIVDDISFILRKRKSNSKINQLPEQVIHRREGYITRMYDAAYLVRSKYIRRINGGDIKDKHKVLGIENNLARAHALRNEMIESAISRDRATAKDPVAFDEDASRRRAEADISVGSSDELDLSSSTKYYDPTNIDWMIDTGHLYTSPRRPKELQGSRDPVTGRSRRLVLPVNESVERSQFAAAHMNAIEPLINKLENNWVERFGKMYENVTPNGGFPWMGKLTMPPNLDPALRAEHDAAVALSEYVKNIAGVNESAIKRGTRNTMVRIAENLMVPKIDHWKNRIAEGLMKHRDLNIIDTAKAIAFFQLITMRPARQALLQANQMSLYMNRGDYGTYFLLGEGKKEFTSMWVALLAKSTGNYDSTAHTIASSFGYTKEQLDELVDTYVRSGMPASIDSHMWVASSTLDRDFSRLVREMKSGPLTTAKDFSARGINTGHKWIRRMGFDLGEQTQLLGAFLAEKRAWQVANPNKSKLWAKENNFRTIAGNARTLSGNMNRAGSLHFQSGALGLAFQFMSHAAKMTSLLAPRRAPRWMGGFRLRGIEKIAGEHLTDQEKYRMMINQVLMYGTGGLGLTELYEKVRDEFTETYGEPVPDDISMAVEEGFIGSILNMGIRIANGEDAFTTGKRDVADTDLEFSKNLSPLGGTPFWTEASPFRVVMNYVFNTETRLWDIAGPGAEVITRMFGGIPTMYHIMGDASYLDTDEKIEAALVNLGTSLILETDNWSRARYENAVGKYMSRTGNKGVNANSAEILSKTLLGVRSRTSRQLDKINFSVNGIYGGYIKEPDTDYSDLASRAKKDFKHIRRVTELLGKGEVPLSDYESYVKDLAELNALSMDERENLVYRSKLYIELANWYDKDDKELEIIKAFEKVYKQASTDPVTDLFEKIRNSSNFKHKEELIRALEQKLL